MFSGAAATHRFSHLRRHGDAPLNGADAHNYPDDIPGLLNTVEAMLEKHTRPQPIDKKPMLRREH